MKKYIAWLSCLVLLCTLAAAPALAAEKVTYNRLYASEVSTLNYLKASAQWEQTIPANVIDTLVEYDNFGNIIPGLATEWKTSEDGLVWTFTLRQGQKWYDHQGNEKAEVTAHDFVSAMEYVLNPAYENTIVSQVYIIKNAQHYYKGKMAAPAEGEEPVEPIDFSEVGIKALDDYTLEYTLEKPVPYFLSALTYVCFMPAYGPLLEELGEAFGASDNSKLYYCGAYILTEFEPQGRHVYTKNLNNWDADRVYIDEVVRTYSPEALTLAPIMALRGEVDFATINNEILDDWKATYGEYISKNRPSGAYSYFYAFNFDPQYEQEFEPDNWRKAVNNTNFRHAIMSGFDRLYAMYALDPDNPKSVVQHSITPGGFTQVEGTDFAQLPAFENINQHFYNREDEEASKAKALAYKAKAMEELTTQGVTFPVKMVLAYRVDMKDWENESVLVKQQLESMLGTDFIEISLFGAPKENFLSDTRTAGKYSFMRVNWGADYQDPETFTDPLKKREEEGVIVGNSYNKMDLLLTSEDFVQTRDIVEAYYEKTEEAKAEVMDMKKRYELFAQAEALLIENAIVIPYYITPPEYQASKINPFEGQFASFGICSIGLERMKWQHVQDHFVTPGEYEEYKRAFEAAQD